MPFGLRNAAQTFQRFLDQVLRGMPFVYAYIDDILVARRTEQEHQDHLRCLFRKLDEHGLMINPEKSHLGVSSVSFLGHQIDCHGIRPLTSKVKAIQEYPQPQTARDLRGFLGLVNFYRRFVPGCAKLLQPLQEILLLCSAFMLATLYIP